MQYILLVNVFMINSFYYMFRYKRIPESFGRVGEVDIDSAGRGARGRARQSIARAQLHREGARRNDRQGRRGREEERGERGAHRHGGEAQVSALPLH